jgi:hypothetical protein
MVILYHHSNDYANKIDLTPIFVSLLFLNCFSCWFKNRMLFAVIDVLIILGARVGWRR